MQIRAAILTISDSAVAGTREDKSGPALRERCEQLSWQVLDAAVVADEKESIAGILIRWADSGSVDFVMTTGGTGIAPRDVTPEATRSVVDREIPGIAELMRQRGLEQTKFSMLARGIAGSRKETLIVNLPGSPKGAVFSLGLIEPLIPHVVQLLRGDTAH
jgi:molybdenum cofactor synthesis domain-containing protein